MDVSQCRNLEGSTWGNGQGRVARMESAASIASVASDSSAASGGGGVNGDVVMGGTHGAVGFLHDLSDGGRVKFVSVADGRFRGA